MNIITPSDENKSISKSISKWTWARKHYIETQKRLGKNVSPIKALDPATAKRQILELLHIREKLLKKALTQKDVERFHKKYIRSKMTRQAKRQTLEDLLKDALNPYDVAMALEIEMEDAQDVLVDLEREGKIKPISDVLRTGYIGAIHIELSPT